VYLIDTTGVEPFIEDRMSIGFDKTLFINGRSTFKFSFINFLMVINDEGDIGGEYGFGTLPVRNDIFTIKICHFDP
jgi:hypothetical protein